MSFGACTADAGYKATATELAALEKAVVSVFVSSGDTWPYPGPLDVCGTDAGVSYLGSDPSVVSVGGTTLTLDRANAIQTETAWRLSGGGEFHPVVRCHRVAAR